MSGHECIFTCLHVYMYTYCIFMYDILYWIKRIEIQNKSLVERYLWKGQIQDMNETKSCDNDIKLRVDWKRCLRET